MSRVPVAAYKSTADDYRHVGSKRWLYRMKAIEQDAAERDTMENLAARFASLIWEKLHTCPECGNVRREFGGPQGHFPSCPQIYEREYKDLEKDWLRVFRLAFVVPARRELSNTIRTGWFEGGPEDGVSFLRNWNTSEMRSGKHLYRANRDRVEDRGDGELALVFEYVGEEPVAV